jgi:hypothetical protein
MMRIVVAVDSTEFKVACRGDWIREEHGVERRRVINVKDALMDGANDKGDFLSIKKNGYDNWKKVHGYSKRWAAECVLSTIKIKRIFGETVRATSTEGMSAEIRRIFTFYTIILIL